MADVSPLLGQWTNFYVIMGSSAGALTGLQFVVIALISEADMSRSMLEIRAFGTPTMVQFCFVLLMSGILTAPWHGMWAVSLCLSACGVAGVVYAIRVIRHAKRQTGYTPEASDWFWYTLLPFSAHLILLIAGIALAWHAVSLFVLGATALLLLFNGIHNAWDTVTYIAIGHRESKQNETP